MSFLILAAAQQGSSGASYLFDTVPMDFGFSFRQLSSSTTDVITARRGGDDVEQAFAPNELSGLASFASGGNNFAYQKEFFNQGSNSGITTIAQTDTTFQPRLVNDGTSDVVNGFNSPVFSGNQFLSSEITLNPHAGFDVFIVAKHSATGAVFNFSDSTNAAKFIAIDDAFSTTTIRGYYRWTTAALPAQNIGDNSVFHVVHAYFDGTTFYLSVNGGSYASVTPTITASNSDRLEIGRLRSNVPIYANMQCSEVLVKMGNLTTQQRTDVLSNINSYYSIY